MQVKIVDAMSAKSLETKINDFLRANEQVKVIDIKITAGFGNVTALIMYES